MNWGTGIVIFFSFFAISMVTAVVATTRHAPQMVQKDYYNLDLNYQAHLEKKQNTASLPVLPSAKYEATTGSLEFQLPEGMTAQTGSIKCYRSATAREDILVKLEQTNRLSIPAQDFTAGRWHLEADWVDQAGKTYFWETALQVTSR